MTCPKKIQIFCLISVLVIRVKRAESTEICYLCPGIDYQEKMEHFSQLTKEEKNATLEEFRKCDLLNMETANCTGLACALHDKTGEKNKKTTFRSPIFYSYFY